MQNASRRPAINPAVALEYGIAGAGPHHKIARETDRAGEVVDAVHAARVQKAARGMDRIYHLAGPARVARDLVMRAQSGHAVLERYRWIYGWTP